MNNKKLTRIGFERLIKTQIPITQHMGLKVRRASMEDGVELTFPLKPNVNHKGTAFGGSLVGGQALASWAWIVLLLQHHEIKAEVVVQRQRSEFLKPVSKQFCVIVRPPKAADISKFLTVLGRRGKSRIEIFASVYVGEQMVSHYAGEYVAVKVRV